MLTLAVEKRDVLGKKSKKIRAEGKMPAVLYGKKEQAMPIAVSHRAFEKIFKEAGYSTVVALEGLGSTKEALIHDVAIDPVKDTPRHADFYVIEKGQKVQVEVPIEFEGVAPAVKELGGFLVKVLHTVEVEAEPSNLPQEIVVDVSSLVDFTSQICIKDLRVPAGVVILGNPEEVVVLASEAVEEKIEETVAPDLSTIEVAKKGKQEEVTEESAEKTEKK
jgi:large subunit ribosomal protein L25